MKVGFERFCVFLFFVFSFCLLFSCSSRRFLSKQVVIYEGRAVSFGDLNPDVESEGIGRKNLIVSESISFHVVWISSAEKPHIHKEHDLIVFLIYGSGEFHVGDKVFRMKRGDSAYVPRGTPHWFKNISKTAIAYVIFIPPFDGKDNIPLSSGEEEGMEKEK